MDDLDLAQEIFEKEQEKVLKARRPEGPKATGACLYCGEEIEDRWCSVDCRDAYEDELRRRQR